MKRGSDGYNLGTVSLSLFPVVLSCFTFQYFHQIYRTNNPLFMIITVSISIITATTTLKATTTTTPAYLPSIKSWTPQEKTYSPAFL
jgi:hypothetical protein